MKSRTSATLRIRAICEYTILRLFTIMFSFLVAMFSFPADFPSIICRADGAFNKLLKRGVLILGMHFT